MRKKRIKNRGKVRNIYIPSFEERLELERILTVVNPMVQEDPRSNCVYGFMVGKSVVDNARQHIGYYYSISMDIKNFFDSITKKEVQKFLPHETCEKVTVEGRIRQGLPTSPQISNLVFLEYDDSFQKFASQKGGVYTRYADDMTFSFNSYRECLLSKELVEKTLEGKFKLNKKKTKIQYALPDGRRNRIITGVSVSISNVKPTRKLKRKLRKSEFKKKLSPRNGKIVRHCMGLNSWKNFIEKG